MPLNFCRGQDLFMVTGHFPFGGVFWRWLRRVSPAAGWGVLAARRSARRSLLRRRPGESSELGATSRESHCRECSTGQHQPDAAHAGACKACAAGQHQKQPPFWAVRSLSSSSTCERILSSCGRRRRHVCVHGLRLCIGTLRNYYQQKNTRCLHW